MRNVSETIESFEKKINNTISRKLPDTIFLIFKDHQPETNNNRECLILCDSWDYINENKIRRIIVQFRYRIQQLAKETDGNFYECHAQDEVERILDQIEVDGILGLTLDREGDVVTRLEASQGTLTGRLLITATYLSKEPYHRR